MFPVAPVDAIPSAEPTVSVAPEASVNVPPEITNVPVLNAPLTVIVFPVFMLCATFIVMLCAA